PVERSISGWTWLAGFSAQTDCGAGEAGRIGGAIGYEQTGAKRRNPNPGRLPAPPPGSPHRRKPADAVGAFGQRPASLQSLKGSAHGPQDLLWLAGASDQPAWLSGDTGGSSRHGGVC